MNLVEALEIVLERARGNTEGQTATRPSQELLEVFEAEVIVFEHIEKLKKEV